MTKAETWIFIIGKLFPDDERAVTKHSFFIWLYPVKTISIAFVRIKRMQLVMQLTWAGWWTRASEWQCIQAEPSSVSWPHHNFRVLITRTLAPVRMIMVIVTWSNDGTVRGLTNILFIWRCHSVMARSGGAWRRAMNKKWKWEPGAATWYSIFCPLTKWPKVLLRECTLATGYLMAVTRAGETAVMCPADPRVSLFSVSNLVIKRLKVCYICYFLIQK